MKIIAKIKPEKRKRMLHILDETLTYEVDQIRIVLPEEVKDIEIIGVSTVRESISILSKS